MTSAGCETEAPSDDGAASTQTSQGTGGTPSVAAAVTVGVGAGAPAVECGSPSNTLPIGDCNVLDQDCPEGMACEPIAANGQRPGCVPNEGVKGPGDSCVTNESCRAGLHCVFNRCSPICCPATNEPCGANGICNVDSPFGQYSAQMCSYLPSCTLFTGECDMGSLCYPLMDEGNSVCAPITGPTVGLGEPCQALNECDDSMICNANVCRWACYLDGVGLAEGLGGCGTGEACMPTGQNPPQNVGVCLSQ